MAKPVRKLFGFSVRIQKIIGKESVQMAQFLKSIFFLSTIGGITALFLLLLKPLTKRTFGYQWQYYIWLLVLVLMLLPIRFPFSAQTPTIQPSQTQPAQQTAQPATQAQEATPVPPRQTQIPALAANRFSTPFQIGPFLIRLLFFLWLGGTLIFFLGGLCSYFRFLSSLRKDASASTCPMLETVKKELQIRANIQVRITTLLTAPMMTGLFRPVLLLPDTSLKNESLRFILLHELTHYKRRDLYYKWFAFFVNAIHWFNPLIYVVIRQINETCEISCDLSVTKDLCDEEKSQYMTTILHLAANQPKQKGGI